MVLPQAFVGVAAEVVVMKVVVTGMLEDVVVGAAAEVDGEAAPDVVVGTAVAVAPLQLPGNGVPSVGFA